MIEKKPRISIVMSVYNDEKYLSDSIDSMLRQSFTDYEFIIINDGSTDGTMNILEDYKKKDSRIFVISRDNKGLAYSLNEGIMKAKGEYIARMDSDDIALPERLKIQYEFMEKNKDIGVCGTLAYVFSSILEKNKIYNLPETHNDLKPILLFSSCFIHPSVIIRKSVIDALPEVYDCKFTNSQDYDLWSRLERVAQFYNIQKPLMYYRFNNKGITASVEKDSLLNRYPLVTKIQHRELVKLGFFLGSDELLLHFKLGHNKLSLRDVNKAKKHIYKMTKNKIIDDNTKRYLNTKYFISITKYMINNKKIPVRSVLSIFYIRGMMFFLKKLSKDLLNNFVWFY